MKLPQTSIRRASRRALVACGVVGLCLALNGCEKPPPRTFADFMEDPIARDGTIARCNADREATLHDLECANARRAQSAVALRQERERRELLEQESERKLEEYRRQLDQAEEIARKTALAVIEAERAAYEERWSKNAGGSASGTDAAGAGIGGAGVGGAGIDGTALDGGQALSPEAAAQPERPADNPSLITLPSGLRSE